MRSISVVRSVLTLTAAMIAVPSFASPAYTASGVIDAINARENSVDVHIPLADNPMGCSQPQWFRLSTSAANYAGILSFVLTQHVLQKPVKVYVNSCDTDGASIILTAGNF
uniref:hypothetical protein n=1 Tax=uncultured Sphingomonas sp. TaxID=158754 RepID=UPI0035CB42CE